MPRLLTPLLALLLTACAGQANTASTDSRATGDPALDAKICASVRARLSLRDPASLSVLSVLCNSRLVVIAGALPPDYTLAVEAVHIATRTPGVRRVETYFVPKAAQDTSDSVLAARARLALDGDAGTGAAGVDLTVVGSTVVLVGMVDDQAKADRIIASASSVAGVKGVKSFLQLRP